MNGIGLENLRVGHPIAAVRSGKWDTPEIISRLISGWFWLERREGGIVGGIARPTAGIRVRYAGLFRQPETEATRARPINATVANLVSFMFFRLGLG